MELFKLNDTDKKLIEKGMHVITENFDDDTYNHTVGCALLCKN